jgi:hypothetical protein
MQPTTTTERWTETFRGVNCKKNARKWRDSQAKDGWREASFSGVSGVGGYKTCSMTLVRP